MRFKFGKKILCGALAACMCVAFVPAQAFADEGDYLSEVSIAYGEAGASQLEDAGYTVVTDADGNAADVNRGNDNATYIGYKTTDDASKAITDLAVMNMKVGYSISAWKDELAKNTNAATAMSYEFQAVIKEFRANYKASASYDSIVTLMNNYLEDDSNMGMGDYLLSTKKCTADSLAKVMLQSNPANFLAVEYLLSKGVATDWTSKIPDLDVSASYDVDDATVQALADQVIALRSKLVAYGKSTLKLSAGFVDELEDADADDAVDALKYGTIYETLKGIKYGDGTLLDLFLTKKSDLTTDMLAPVASLLTEGQATLMPVVGIDTLILDSVDMGSKAQTSTLQSAQSSVESDLKDANVESISMYEGVNREIFTGNNVALTNDALRTQSVTGDNTSMFFNNTASTVLYIVAATLTLASAVCYAINVYENIHAGVDSELFSAWLKSELGDPVSNAYYAARGLGTACKVAFGVLAAAACIAAGVGIAIDLYNYYHPKRYTIPEVIVDQTEDADGGSIYVSYSVARKADGTVADLCGGEGLWNCLYYTTDPNAGDPIIASDLLVQTDATNEDGLSAVHEFGDVSAAFNMNFGTSAAKKGVYMFFSRDEDAYEGSTFGGTGYLFTAGLIGLLVGVAATAAVFSARNRRRKEA